MSETTGKKTPQGFLSVKKRKKQRVTGFAVCRPVAFARAVSPNGHWKHREGGKKTPAAMEKLHIK